MRYASIIVTTIVFHFLILACAQLTKTSRQIRDTGVVKDKNVQDQNINT